MNQKRTCGIVTLVIMSLFSVIEAAAEDTNIEKGVSYLVEMQDPAGHWNQEERKQRVDTLESFRALQRVRGGENALNNALKYFSGLSESTNENLSSKLLVLSNSTADVSKLVTTLASRQKSDGGWGLVDSKRGSIPDTVLAVNALISSEKSSSTVLNSAGDFLIRSQQESGAWIFSDELSLSDTIHTAQVLIVLQNLRDGGYLSGSGLEQAMSKAQKYLEDRATGTGAYGTLLDTAWTYLAFSRLKQPSELQQTLTYITGQQQANGSWNNQIYDTAICLQALSAIQAPQTDLADLEITEQNISFTPTAPLSGNQVTITATISNIGKLDAHGVKVEFFNGDPRLGGTSLCAAQTVDIVADGVAVVTGNFVATDMVGTQQIVVFIDRDNAIQENSKANNIAAKLLSVGGQPDLHVTSNDITLSNPNPKAFETVDLIVTIHNIGNESVTNVPVQIFDNGKELISLTLEGVNAGSSNKAIITTGFTAETHEIKVVVATAANETHEANNTATRSFTIEAEPDVTAIKDALGNIPMKCIYDEDGRLIATEDANGNRIAVTHDLTGRTETVTDRMGNPTTYTYDECGNITAIINSQGAINTFSYDQYGNMTSATNDHNYSIHFSYDNMGNQTSITDALGNTFVYEYNNIGKKIKITDPLNRVTINEYDGKGHLQKVTNPLGISRKIEFSANGNPQKAYDAKGTVIGSFEYDSAGNAISRVITQIQQTSSYDKDGRELTNGYLWSENGISKNVEVIKEYDDAGNVVKEQYPGGNLLKEYDELGRVSRITDYNGIVTSYKYDLRGNVIEENNSVNITRRVYDANSRVTAEGKYDIDGVLLSPITHMIYDSLGRNIRTEILSGAEIIVSENQSQLVNSGSVLAFSSTVYNSIGQVIQTTDAKGNTTKYEYDPNGKLISSTDPLNNRTQFVYDAAGQRIAIIDALNRKTNFEYNALGQLVKTIYPDGSFCSINYDTRGQKIQETDPNNNSTKYEYDNYGHLIAVSKCSNELTARWEYTYDQMGNRTSIKDPNGRITSFKYNEYNLCTEKTLPGGEKAKIEYDEKGRMTCQIDFSGQKAKYYYNTQGLLQKQQLFTANSDSVYKEIAFSYDELGRKKEIKTTDFSKSNANNETIISLSYDVRGNVIKRSTPEGTVNYSYDLQSGQKNRVWCERSVDGVNKTSTDIRYTYDEIYRLKSITVHCRNGEQLQVPEVTSFTYTKTGTRESIERPNGIKTLYQYNLLDRLIKLSHSNETEKIAEYIYSLDASGRRVGVSEEILQPGGERVSATIAYEYDGLGRLIQEERVGGGSFLATYKYDLCNNRLKKQQTINGISETIDYSYDQNDKLIKETSSISGVTEYIYDSNGSVINKYNENQFSYQFAYDPQNRLISSTVSRKEGEQKEINVNISSTYSYDYEGNQVGISQTINGTTEQRFNLIDSGLTGYPQVFEEMSAAAGTTLNSYIIGDDIIYQTNSASTIYFLYDGHGSTRQLANENSAISEIYNYDAYGQILNGGVGAIYQTAATSLLYSGEIFDAGIQMQNLRTRYYDPSLGRFVQQDSFEGDINKPQSLHKYGYVYADPVNYIDPSGEFAAGIFLDLANVGFRMANFIAALSLLNEASISGATLNRIAREERTQEKATLIVHGVTGKNEGWASAFINSLSSDSYTGSMATGNLEKIPGATTNDFYEYTWSGFSLPLVAMPVISVHRIAYINLIYSSIVIWMKGYEKINVIAHSWGTTLTYDLLSSGGIVFNDWITMGSPLKNTTPRPAMLGGRWINYWCTTDPVCFFAMYPPWQLIPNVAAPGLMLNDNVSHGCNHKVPGTEHMIWAHSVYWNNDFVINSIKNYIR